jgi:hypothetical protein
LESELDHEISGDGVPDGCDLCPNTIPGAPVDADGCPSPANPADYDLDCDVDQDDYMLFEVCTSGPTAAHDANCADRDFDLDGDVDGDDFGDFQTCFSGAGITADPNCPN